MNTWSFYKTCCDGNLAKLCATITCMYKETNVFQINHQQALAAVIQLSHIDTQVGLIHVLSYWFIDNRVKKRKTHALFLSIYNLDSVLFFPSVKV